MNARDIEIYDLESYINFFSATFLNKKTREKRVFVISNKKNDYLELVASLKSNKNLVLVGFNNKSYDDTILNRLISGIDQLKDLTSPHLTRKINNLSRAIINFDKEKKEMQKLIRHLRSDYHYFTSIDLLEVIREGYATKSLKGVAINLKWPRIQDLPIPFDAVIEDDQIEPLLDYNFNDVLVTDAIHSFVKDRLEMREILSEQYQVSLLSDADSTIAKTLFNKFYSEKSGQDVEEFKYKRTKRSELIVGDIILPWIAFKTPEYQSWLEELRKVRVWNIEGKELKEGWEEDEETGELKFKKKTKAVQFKIPELESQGMTYRIGLGGIHSKDKPGIFTNQPIDGEEMMLLDVDVASQYPRRIIHSKIVPEHLDPDLFVEVLSLIVDTRIINKAKGKVDKIARIIAEGLKITVNTVYGLFNFAYYFLYDPKATYAVTINNQLVILMLIEELNQNEINVISANTDGIICFTPLNQLERIREIYHLWEQTTGFTLEETFYSRYIRRDINNYITIKTDGEVKNKGIFIPQNGILKGYNKPIVAIALQEYFLHGKQPKDVIGQLGYEYKFVNPDFPKGEIRKTDIYDFCMAKKVGDTFEGAIFHSAPDANNYIAINKLQKNIRYFASTDGGTIYKVKKEEGKSDSLHNMLVDSPVTIINDYFESSDYHINYQYYLNEIEKIIAKVEGRKWIDPNKLEEKIGKQRVIYDNLLARVIDMKEKGKDHLKSFTSFVNRLIKIEEELNQLMEMKDGK